jgi:hypothetical protein
MSITIEAAGSDELEALCATYRAVQRRIVELSLRRIAAIYAERLPGTRLLHLDTDTDGGLYVESVSCEHGSLFGAHDKVPDEVIEEIQPLVGNLSDWEHVWRPFTAASDDRRGTYVLDLSLCATAQVPAGEGEQLYTVVGAWDEAEPSPSPVGEREPVTPEAWIEVVVADNPDAASSQAIALQRYTHADAVGRGSQGHEPYPIAVFEGGMPPVRS